METPSQNEDPRANPAVHGRIARRAHELWEQEGRRDGQHERHWLEAERQLRGTPVDEQDALAHPAPDLHGNPAYPSLAARTLMVADNTGKNEPVKKLPAARLSSSRS